VSRGRRGRSELVGYLLVALAAVLWGLLGPVARIALQEGLQPLELGFWRALIAGSLCALVSMGRRTAPIPRREIPGVLGFGVVGVAIFYAAYFQAVDLGGAALAAILLYTAPAWVALASFLWLGERITGRTAMAVGLTMSGVAAVALAGGEIGRASGGGVAWGLIAGLSYASYYVVGKWYFSRYGTLTVLAYALPAGALLLLPFVAFQPRSGAVWLVILFVAVVPTFAAYLIYGAGLVRVNATRAATVAAIEPVVAAAAAFLMWDERFTAIGYLGAALVLSAVFLVASAARVEAAPR
jgi:drug/metabolite transporter, DME family